MFFINVYHTKKKRILLKTGILLAANTIPTKHNNQRFVPFVRLCPSDKSFIPTLTKEHEQIELTVTQTLSDSVANRRNQTPCTVSSGHRKKNIQIIIETKMHFRVKNYTK